jgi:hypothetical protein
LQASREDLASLAAIELDESVPITTLIIDCTTDLRHFHLSKCTAAAAAAAAARASTAAAATENEHERGDSAADEVALAAELKARCGKDEVPVDFIADAIAKLAARVASTQRTLHVLLTGCNTTSVALPLQAKVVAAHQQYVWLLATNNVWPSDLSFLLWHLYGETVSVQLDQYRLETRTLIDQFTCHYERQNIVMEALEEHGMMRDGSLANVSSLADLVHLDRLDRIVELDGGFAEMMLI